MEEQTMKENPGIPPEEQGEEKTFTQEDLNRILKDRLAKERAKSSKTLEEREAELTRREMRLTAREKFIDNDLPLDLIDIVRYDDEEQLDEVVNKLKEALKPSGSGGNSYVYDPQRGGTAPQEDPVKKAMGL